MVRQFLENNSPVYDKLFEQAVTDKTPRGLYTLDSASNIDLLNQAMGDRVQLRERVGSYVLWWFCSHMLVRMP